MNGIRILKMTVLAMMLTGSAVLVSCTGSTMPFNSGFKSNPDARITERKVSIPAVDELNASTGISVEYTPGADNSVTVSAPADLQDKIEVKVSDGKLKVCFTEKISSGRDRVKITVVSPEILEFDVSSGAQLSVASGYSPGKGELSFEASSGSSITVGNVKSGAVGVEASSGAAVQVVAEADALVCEASSGSSVTVSGVAASVSYSASSGAAIHAGGLKADAGKASASSGGSVTSNIISPQLKMSSGGSVNNSTGN